MRRLAQWNLLGDLLASTLRRDLLVVRVSGQSMLPTLRPDDLLFCSRRRERWVNAIVIDEVQLPGGGVTRHIKRLTGLAGDVRGDVEIPQGWAWIEGDNPDASTDSRTWGPVPRDAAVLDVRPRMRTTRHDVTTRIRETWLDMRHGIATRGFVRADSSGFSPAAVHPYVATPWDVVRQALDQLPLTPEDVLLDYGCGRGRVLALALERGIQRAIGIEIVPVLAGDARRNLAKFGNRCEIIEGDAAALTTPDDASVIYVFNSFPASVLAQVVARINESLRRRPRRAQLLTYGIDRALMQSLVGVEPRRITDQLLSFTLHPQF
jgi:signal peptidase I